MADTLEILLDALRAIAEPTRLRILAICRTGELTVTELCRILGQSQPRISRHLKLLVDAGVLEKVREGNWIFHRLAQGAKAAPVAEAIAALLPEDDEGLIQDMHRLAQIKTERASHAADYFSKNAEHWGTLRALHVDEGELERAITTILPAHDAGALLDVGTGTARMLELFGPEIERGEGIDMSHHMLTVARANLERAGLNNCRVRQGDMYHLPFAQASFNSVLFHQVLHFADHPANAVAEAARVLHPGGRLLIVDFAPHDVETLRTEHAHRRLGFPADEVTGWLEAAGLETTKVQHLKGEPLTVTLWLATRTQSFISDQTETNHAA